MNHAGDRTILKITIVTFVVIITMLLLFYRSIVTVVLLLAMVGRAADRGTGHRRVPRAPRDHRHVDVRGEHVGVA